MAYEQKSMSGVLFKNDRREKETHPHATGRILLDDGRTLWVSAWTKDGKKGKFQSLSVKWADERAAEIREEVRDNSLADELDDDLPF